MLVLSRRVNEEVVIKVGEVEIVVIVAEVYGGKARLGFTAPQHVKIMRREILDATSPRPEKKDEKTTK